MKKKIQIDIMIFLGLIVLISGCSSNSMNNFTNIKENNFRAGTDGIIPSIIGPNKITVYGDEESSFPETYSVKIDNKGASDIASDSFYSVIHLQNRIEFVSTVGKTSGTNTEKTLSLDSFSAPKSLSGKTKYSSKGDTGQFDFTVRGYPPKFQGIEGKITAEFCYKYGTILEDSVCINTRTHSDNKGCSKDKYSYSGQGAPIRISEVDIIPINDTTSSKIKQVLIVTVENVGGELFSLPENFKESCTAKKDIKKLRIKVLLGTETLNCLQATDGTLELKENKKEIRCESGVIESTDPSGFYNSPLRIELEYGYHGYIDKSVDIVRESYIK